MKPYRVLAALGLLLAFAAQEASAQTKPMRIRGTVTALDGNVLSVKARDGKDLKITLEYKGGAQKIIVPEGVPIFTTVPADRSLLVPGAYIFAAAQVAADGKLTASRIQVSKDGVKPAQ